MKPKKRWYDAHPHLAESLEVLKGIDKATRDRIVAHVIGYINDLSPGLLEKYLLEFPLDRERRRWYDKNPYLWLMVNGLKYAPPALLRKVTNYMKKALPRKAKPVVPAVRRIRSSRRPKSAARNIPRARTGRPTPRRAVRT